MKKLLNQFEQSEIIRKEQAKLIKSLQTEINILRKTQEGNDPYSNDNNVMDNVDMYSGYIENSMDNCESNIKKNQRTQRTLV